MYAIVVCHCQRVHACCFNNGQQLGFVGTYAQGVALNQTTLQACRLAAWWQPVEILYFQSSETFDMDCSFLQA